MSMLWLDMEATGSHPAKDIILEIGWMITDDQCEAYPNFVGSEVLDVKYFDVDYRLKTTGLDGEKVREMHVKSGLLKRLIDHDTSGLSLRQVDAKIASQLQQCRKPENEKNKRNEFVLAGSGVGHYDLAFIKEQMPITNSLLAFYVIDVGVIRRTLRMCGRDDLKWKTPEEKKAHRAYDDVLDHIEEFKFYRKALSEVPTVGITASVQS